MERKGTRGPFEIKDTGRLDKDILQLVWWFGNPLQSCDNLVKRVSEPNHTRIIGFLVSFESEVR